MKAKRVTRICDDPSREEMLACIASCPAGAEADAFEVEEAIFWFASEWHGGQGTDLYEALGASPYRPGMFARHVDRESVAGILYEELEATYVTEA